MTAPREGLPPLRLVVAGIVAGVGTYLVGYAATYVAVARDVEDALRSVEAVLELVAAEPIGTWRIVGWVFYSAHFVASDLVATLGPIQARTTVDIVGQSGDLTPLYLVPIVTLAVAGIAVSLAVSAADGRDGAIAGATVVLGYLPMAAIGLVAFAYGGSGPDPIAGLLLAGIAYPVVFGAAGGAAGSWLRRR